MIVKVTQYGYPGDPDADTNTLSLLGFANNRLDVNSCALTLSSCDGLGIGHKDHVWIRIHFADGSYIYRRHDDTAPESDPRVDLFMPGGYQPTMPDMGYAEIVTPQPWLV